MGNRQQAGFGGMFVIGLVFTIFGITGKATFLIFGLAFLLSAGIGAAVSRSKSSGWQPPVTKGPATRLRAINSFDQPISKSATWHREELEVRSDQASTQKLFVVELSQVDQCMICYSFSIQTNDLGSPVYPEMWCRIPGKGEFFSRGLDNKIVGNHQWLAVKIPFYLQQGQIADQLQLNLVFEGPGTVRLKDIEVTSTPIE